MEEWIQKYGTTALKRAYSENYSVEKGVTDILLAQLEEGLDLSVVLSWTESEERTSPNDRSFKSRDVVQDCVDQIELPEGWRAEVGRISRITLTDFSKVTGVFVTIFSDTGKIMRRACVLFE